MKQIRQSKSLYFYVPKQFKDEVELTITYSALSHGQLMSLENLLEQDKNKEFSYQSCRLAIQSIEDNSGNILPFSSLSPNTLDDVSYQILTHSSITPDDLKLLRTAVDIKFGKTFKGDTWNCETCQEKRLDRTRNCGYLGNQDKDSTFKVMDGKQVYTSCPIYGLDLDILADAVDSYVMYDSKLLPDAGGLYDQTRFFVISSSVVTQKIREEEAKEAKSEERKRNR